jgi:hypothetical protein
MPKLTTGRCLCGDLRYQFEGDPLWQSYCHCESCRRHTSSPVAAFIGLDVRLFRYTHGTPATFASSPDAKRGFCGRCGSPMSFEGAKWPGEIHIYVGTLSDPAAFVPTAHFHTSEQLPWFHIADGLPRNLGHGDSLSGPK